MILDAMIVLTNKDIVVYHCLGGVSTLLEIKSYMSRSINMGLYIYILHIVFKIYHYTILGNLWLKCVIHQYIYIYTHIVI